MLKPQKTQPTKIIKFKKQIQSSYKLFFYVGKTLFSQNFIGVSIFVAIAVWTIWLTVAGPSRALSNLTENWEASITMIFGSIIAGGTSMGGGAVAFPVFTKVLHLPPAEAKVFSLANFDLIYRYSY
ncbi:MAG: hypothetical protein QNJ49_20130 [Mastigocoleus sp. MO_167.B18]|nr:hypothetical protein [Mastigocoleus sp. MO_167.B18]